MWYKRTIKYTVHTIEGGSWSPTLHKAGGLYALPLKNAGISSKDTPDIKLKPKNLTVQIAHKRSTTKGSPFNYKKYKIRRFRVDTVGAIDAEVNDRGTYIQRKIPCLFVWDVDKENRTIRFKSVQIDLLNAITRGLSPFIVKPLDHTSLNLSQFSVKVNVYYSFTDTPDTNQECVVTLQDNTYTLDKADVEALNSLKES